jgi:hypothetical protein
VVAHAVPAGPWLLSRGTDPRRAGVVPSLPRDRHGLIVFVGGGDRPVDPLDVTAVLAALCLPDSTRLVCLPGGLTPSDGAWPMPVAVQGAVTALSPDGWHLVRVTATGAVLRVNAPPRSAGDQGQPGSESLPAASSPRRTRPRCAAGIPRRRTNIALVRTPARPAHAGRLVLCGWPHDRYRACDGGGRGRGRRHRPWVRRSRVNASCRRVRRSATRHRRGVRCRPCPRRWIVSRLAPARAEYRPPGHDPGGNRSGDDDRHRGTSHDPDFPDLGPRSTRPRHRSGGAGVRAGHRYRLRPRPAGRWCAGRAGSCGRARRRRPAGTHPRTAPLLPAPRRSRHRGAEHVGQSVEP